MITLKILLNALVNDPNVALPLMRNKSFQYIIWLVIEHFQLISTGTVLGTVHFQLISTGTVCDWFLFRITEHHWRVHLYEKAAHSIQRAFSFTSLLFSKGLWFHDMDIYTTYHRSRSVLRLYSWLWLLSSLCSLWSIESFI